MKAVFLISPKFSVSNAFFVMKNIVGILLLLTVSLNVHASLNVSDRTVQVDSLLKQAFMRIL